VTWRFTRGTTEDPTPASGEGTRSGRENGGDRASGDEGDGEWEDVEDEDSDDLEDEESRVAVDRVLKKYQKAQVMDDDLDGGFDARHERSVREKMDEWKRGYYKVCLSFFRVYLIWDARVDLRYVRANWRFHMMTRRICATWCFDTLRGCSGSCTIIMGAWHRGDGSMIIIMPLVFLVRLVVGCVLP
jgi:hypothetical protein